MAYTYLIGWTQYQKWYYGVRYAKNSTPTDLWKSYFTSSKHVKTFRENYGEPDIIEVRKIFENPDLARKWESKVLRRIKAVSDERFLNQTDNIGISIESALVGSKKSTNMGQKRPHLSELNSKKIGILNPMFGKTGELAPCFGRIGNKHPMFGKKNPKASEVAKRKVDCPHCGKTGNTSNMIRWHFDNCKFKTQKKENKK